MDDTLTMKDARQRYFAANGFGEDGGYAKPTVEVEVFGLRVNIPNTEGRLRAVRYHDLHHVLTDYQTDMAGEAEIAAWELASGCRDLVAAWILNGGAYAYGLLVCPRRVFRAFVRGRHSENLYGRRFDEALLQRTVGSLRRELSLLPGEARTTGGDWLAFAASVIVVVGVPLALLSMLIILIMVLVGLIGALG